MAKIVKIVAGVEEEEQRGHAQNGGGADSGKAQSWAEQLERTYASVGACLGKVGLEEGGPVHSSLQAKARMLSHCGHDVKGKLFLCLHPAFAGSSSGARRGGSSSGGGGSGAGGLNGRPAASSRHQMVSIVNYDLPSGGVAGSGPGTGRHGGASSSGAGRPGGYGGGAGGDYGYVTVDYGSIAGARQLGPLNNFGCAALVVADMG